MQQGGSRAQVSLIGIDVRRRAELDAQKIAEL
jgi:hypothetical protein